MDADTRRRFPWWLLLALVVSILIFWVVPARIGSVPVEIDLAPAKAPAPTPQTP